MLESSADVDDAVISVANQKLDHAERTRDNLVGGRLIDGSVAG